MEFAGDYKNTIKKWLLEKYPDLIDENTENYLDMIAVSYTGTNSDDRAAVLLMNTAQIAGYIKYYSFSLKKYTYKNQEGKQFTSWEKLPGKYDADVAGLKVCYVIDRQTELGYCCIDIQDLKAALEKAEKEYREAQAASDELYQKQKALQEEKEKLDRELLIVSSQLTGKGYAVSDYSQKISKYKTLVDMETM